VLLTYAVLPFGKNMVLANYDAGLLFFLAVGGAVEVAVFMAGWSSRNKYSLLGAMRAIAQMLSYEIPLILSAVTVVMMVGSLNLSDIVQHQNAIPWHLVVFNRHYHFQEHMAQMVPPVRAQHDLELIVALNSHFSSQPGFPFPQNPCANKAKGCDDITNATPFSE